MEKNNTFSHKISSLKSLSKTATKCSQFMGTESLLKIQTTNAQELYNYYQTFNHSQILVLDFRSKNKFEICHFIGSINIPSDFFSLSDFLSFKESNFIRKYCVSKEQKDKFKRRKRWLVVMIAFSFNWDTLIPLIPDLFTCKNSILKSATYAEDRLPLRNALLMQKIIMNEKNRDWYLWKTSMDVFQNKYPFMWKLENMPANTISEWSKYPSEIFENFLYLSNYKVPKDSSILQTLGITHILNVSDWVPNYFEKGNFLGIEYSNISIEDVESAEIDQFFQFAYGHISSCLVEEDEKIDDWDNTVSESDTKDYKGEFDTQTLKLDLKDYTICPWKEDEHKRIISSWDMAVSKIHRKNPKYKLLVHCAMGKSRSATIVTMFIMKKFRLSYDIAIKLVSQRREKIEINAGFVEKLKEFEANGFKFKAEHSDKSNASTEGEEDPPNFTFDQIFY